MIVTYMPQGADEKESLPADGVIIDPTSWIITFVDVNGDEASVEIDKGNIVIVEDEGGDTDAEDSG